MSIAGGAHIAIGTKAECLNVAGLGGSNGVWARRGVTLVNTVPTLINIMTSLVTDVDEGDDGLPASIRLLNLGGEACPPALVERLWRPSLRITNTYGPSETTVTATYDDLLPSQPVTIGKPLPSYHALLLPIADDDATVNGDLLKQPLLLRENVEGELCIGGACLGNGYVGRSELTAEKFIVHPLDPSERLYKTGDRVRIGADLKIQFLGRIDTQVKHRGFRIELGEIESVLASQEDVQTAAVILGGASQEHARLEAFVVLRQGANEDTRGLRATCQQTLPGYMHPEVFYILEAQDMPRLPSGKINTKALLELSERKRTEERKPEDDIFKSGPVDAPQGSPLAVLLSAMAAVFPQQASSGLVLPNADFFDDLGGHSLAAAVFVSKLRKESQKGSPLSIIGLQHIYECRTAEALAKRFEDRQDDNDELSDAGDADVSVNGEGEKQRKTSTTKMATGSKTGDYWAVSQRRFILCGLAQLPALLFFFFVHSVALLVPYLIFYAVMQSTNVGWAVLATYMSFVVMPFFLATVAIMGKWLALGQARAGEYPLYGFYYYRWWLASRFVDLIDKNSLSGSFLYAGMLRTLGAHVGRYCHLDSINHGPAMDLVHIGDDVVVGHDVVLAVEVVERGRLILKPVFIEDETHLGSNSVVEGGARVQHAGELHPLTMLADGQVVPRGERWHGSPARFQRQATDVDLGRPSRPSAARACLMGFAQMFCIAFIMPLLYFAPQLPSLMLFDVAEFRTIHAWSQIAVVCVPASLAYICAVFVELVLLRRLLLGPMKPGSHPLYSFFYLRKWLVDRLMDMSLLVLHPVYASLYVVPYLRALGVRIGKWAEISTARGVNFELADIGDECFVADGVLFGDAAVRGNTIQFEKTTMAPRAFAGNASLIPQGTTLASNTLVGVLSIAPEKTLSLSDGDENGTFNLKEGQSCFGTPPVLMPARQKATATHADHLLYRPRMSQILLRLLIEGLRIWIPRMLVVYALGFSLQINEYAWPRIGVVYSLLMLPLYFFFLFSVPALTITVAMKWILVGRYTQAEWPLWSHKVWLSEAVTSTYESLLNPVLTSFLVGTPYLAMVFRLLGVKIGRRCTLLSHDITEHDMVTLGDEAVVNMHSGPQTHLFEDRVMKVGSVTLGERAVMKPYAICLPNSSVGREAQLGSLSLVMKSETVPEEQAWEGAPIAPRQRRKRMAVSSSEKQASTASKATTQSEESTRSGVLSAGSSSSSSFSFDVERSGRPRNPTNLGDTRGESRSTSRTLFGSSSRSTSRTVFKV